ncbi:MAG: phosphotransferase [Solirubrobacteraceae bacterium]
MVPGLPAHLAHLTPRILAHGQGYVDLEFYGYPPLAETYLYGAWDVGAWALALDAIDDVANSLHSEHAELPPLAASAVLRAMYLEKTAERLGDVLADGALAPLRGDGLIVNGRHSLGLEAGLAMLGSLADAVGLCAPRPLGIVHGDLCLSNILFDRRNGIVRLVDPRGSFGGLPLHGDPRYDHAKLAHSIHGDYDHIVRGLFDLHLASGAARLEVQLTATQRAVKRLYAERAARRFADNLERVRLIEALLFLSMLPLHCDRPRSQLAFAARGLELLTGVAERAGMFGEPLRVAA